MTHTLIDQELKQTRGVGSRRMPCFGLTMPNVCNLWLSGYLETHLKMKEIMSPRLQKCFVLIVHCQFLQLKCIVLRKIILTLVVI